jgi:hypothetical protein
VVVSFVLPSVAPPPPQSVSESESSVSSESQSEPDEDPVCVCVRVRRPPLAPDGTAVFRDRDWRIEPVLVLMTGRTVT